MGGVEVQIGVPSEVKDHEYRVGVTPAGAAQLVIIGGGKVGANAARIGVGVGADVTLLDNSPLRLQHLEDVLGARLRTLHAPAACAKPTSPWVRSCSRPSATTPGSALIDVSIDQGGIAESSRPTTHPEPTYVEEGVVHYCVTNMPGG